MRRLDALTTLLVLLAALAPRPAAASTPRERIVDYVYFYYVGDPNNGSPRYKPQQLAEADLLVGREASDFWQDPDIPGQQDLLRALTREPADADTRLFQELVADLLDVRGERIAVYLMDDAGHPLRDAGKVARDRYNASVDGSGKGVWPSAVDDRAASLTGARLAGAFSTGEVNLHSAKDARGTFLHELTHIQARSDARPHLFTVAGTDYSSGFGGIHYALQLLPDRSLAYDEGVAGAVGMYYEPERIDEAYEDFFKVRRVFTEKAAPDRKKYSKASVVVDVWLYDQILASGVVEDKSGDPRYAVFEMENLPGRFLLHNERLIALVVAESSRRTVGFRGLLQALYRTNLAVVEAGTGANRATSRLTVEELAILLVALGAQIAGSDTPDAALSSGGPTDHLLPLAYLDYMTGRYAQSADDFGAIFKGQLAPDWLEAYWQAGRPLLDSVLPAASRISRSASDFDSIAAAFVAGDQR
jgi:hypothetical protein